MCVALVSRTIVFKAHFWVWMLNVNWTYAKARVVIMGRRVVVGFNSCAQYLCTPPFISKRAEKNFDYLIRYLHIYFDLELTSRTGIWCGRQQRAVLWFSKRFFLIIFCSSSFTSLARVTTSAWYQRFCALFSDEAAAPPPLSWAGDLINFECLWN